MTTREPTTTSGRVELLSPDGLVKSPAFSHVAVVSGAIRTIYIGGQEAVTAEGEIVGKGDLGAQTTQILTNIQTALAAAGATPEHVIKWNVFVVEGQPDPGRVRGVPAVHGHGSGHSPAPGHRRVRQQPRPPRLAGRDRRDRRRAGLIEAGRGLRPDFPVSE